MPRRNVYFLLLFLMCFAVSVKAQVANFTANKTSGCSPLAILFTNTSTGFSPAAVYAWNFGNTNSSALKNPGTTYIDEGTYTVTLTVTDGGNTSSKTMQVIVYKKPVVDFSVDITKGCAPLVVTFTSNSTPGDGTISTYTWDFGDGIAQVGDGTLIHAYNIAKITSPSLTVTNSYGCYSTLSKPQLITVFPQVIASFKTNKTVLCKVPDVATFINNSAGIGALTYNWNFGDGTTSTSSQPAHTYNSRGIYPVKLTATSLDGCTSDTVLTNYINVADYKTNFNVPAVICQGAPAILTDSSQPVPTKEKWLINGVQALDTTALQLQHAFSAPGTYKVKLINTYETCPDTATKTITVQPAPNTKGFVAQVQGSCGAPVTVQFKDTSKNSIGWNWDFTGNGTATSTGQTSSYTFTTDGTYNVTLQTTSASGCTAQVTQPIVVQKITVNILSSQGSLGCDTKTTVFSAQSPENIATYNWDFGDGGTSSNPTPAHTFTSPGIYNVTLNYTTAGGCSGTTNYTIEVYQKPQADFTAVPGTTICGNNPVTFLVTGSNLVGTFLWNFGDPNQYVPASAPFVHRYQHDSVYTVSLIIDNNGCRDTVTKPQYITILPPFPHITSALNTCDGTRGLVTFTDASQKANSYSWDFGDGSLPYTYSSQQTAVQHQYKKNGSYYVALTTSNGSCSASDSVHVAVLLKQKPLLSANITKFCGSDTLRTFLSNLDNNPSAGEGNFGYDITAVQYNSNSVFFGIYNVNNNSGQPPVGIQFSNIDVNQTALRVITTSQNFGCTDTSNYLPFEALGPTANFFVAKNNLCFKTPAVFTDQSTSSHNSPIIKWQWQFGDSSSQTNLQGTSVVHQYAQPGTYNAILTVTDANHCSSSTPANDGYMTITGPKAAFSVSDSVVLPDRNVIFYNQTNTSNTNTGDNVYTWNYGDGTIIRNQRFADSVSHSYRNESTDTVTLIAANAIEHCADTALQVIHVKNPNLSFTYTTVFVNPAASCPPVIGSFVNTSINTTSVSWNFGDGNTADNLNNADHIYQKPGVYKVTLYGYFLDGTVDSVFEWVTIKGPYAVLQTVKPFACGAELITLTAASSNTKNFTWDFGDGTLLINSDTFAGHRYLTPGVYTPSLIVSDGNNCQFPFFLTKPIIIDTLHLAINKNADIACDSSLLLFTPTIESEAKNELGLPLVYHWSFGTGIGNDTADTENSSFVYNKPGSYEVRLSGSSPFGCTYTTTDTVDVLPTPRASIAGPVQVCAGVPVTFIGASTKPVTFSWQFQNGDTSSAQNPPEQVFTAPGLDSVSLIVNDHGCYDTARHPLVINARPFINPSPLTARICESDSVQLQAHDGNQYQWTPAQHIHGANTATPYVFPDTATKYYVEVKNEAGCVSNDSVLITVTQKFKVTAPSPVYICPGGTAQLSAFGADNYHWLDVDVSDPDASNPTVSANLSRVYTVVGSDNYGCFTDTATTQVLTATLPTVNAGADVTTFAGVPVQVVATGSNDIVKWQWIPGTFINCDTCAAVTITPRTNIEYVLKATNQSGCVSYDTIQIHILCKTTLVSIPSAFTPNGDGRNERFTVHGNGIKQVKHFAVFNRLGEVLFETRNFEVTESGYNGWDGTYKNKPMPPGAYVYMAELICDTGELFTYKGTVVLIR